MSAPNPLTPGSRLLALQEALAAQLRSNVDEFFKFIPIITQNKGNIEADIEVALGAVQGQNQKSGLCVICVVPLADVSEKFRNIPGPFFDRVSVVFRVLENVVLNQEAENGTGVRALECAEKILEILHQFMPGEPIRGPIWSDNPSIALGNDPDYLSYDVRLMCFLGLGDRKIVP